MFAKATLLLSTIYIFIAPTRNALIKSDHSTNITLQFPNSEENSTNRLLLMNCSIISGENAVDDIRDFIGNKLYLSDLEYRILQATYTNNGLLFEMSSPQEVKAILNNFSLKFKNKNCSLKPTYKKFVELEVR